MKKVFTKPKTFLITGGAGFIGSHLAEGLLAEGLRVLAIDDLSTGNMANIAHILDSPKFYFSRSSVSNILIMDRLSSQADVIIHLAAAVGVRLVIDNPVRTIETNVDGTETVLKSAKKFGCRVLIASTSEVYGKGKNISFAEQDDLVLGPTNMSRWAYAASKIVDEFLALAYQREYGLEAIPFRLFNTVGPRQTGRYGMVIPRLVSQALRNEPLTVYGDGSQIRCFCDVRDVVPALIELACHRNAAGHVYNIGSNREISILELAGRIKALTHCDSPIVTVPYSEVYPTGFEDIQRRVPNIDKIHRLTGWQPKYTLDETLLSVIEYEKKGLIKNGR